MLHKAFLVVIPMYMQTSMLIIEIDQSYKTPVAIGGAFRVTLGQKSVFWRFDFQLPNQMNGE